MSQTQTNPTLKVVKFEVFNALEIDEEVFEEKIIQVINQKIEGHIKTNNLIELDTDKKKFSCIAKKRDNFFVLRSTIVYKQEFELKSVIEDDLQLYDFSVAIKSSLPSNLSTTFTISYISHKNQLPLLIILLEPILLFIPKIFTISILINN